MELAMRPRGVCSPGLTCIRCIDYGLAAMIRSHCPWAPWSSSRLSETASSPLGARQPARLLVGGASREQEWPWSTVA